MAKKKKSIKKSARSNSPIKEKHITKGIPLNEDEVALAQHATFAQEISKGNSTIPQENQIPSENQDKVQRKNSQVYWILGALAILVLIFFVSYYIFGSFNTIEYNGMTFTKERYGEIPVFHNYYYITPQMKYNLYLRNDPRTNNVPITGYAVEKGIEFYQGNPIYISLSPEGLVGCEYGSVGISNLASFLVENQFKIIGASTDKKQAGENNIKYATCQEHPEGPVIILKGGNQTQIIRETSDCYIIEINNCEILPAIEKFQVQMILDAKARKTAQSQAEN